LTCLVRALTRDRLAIVLGLLAPLAGALILLPLRSHWSNTNVALLLVVIVVAVATLGNRVAGALAALSAFAWFDFFFTVPYLRFTIHGSADITTAVLLLLVGLAVSQLAARTRHLHVLTITDAGYLTLLHDAADLARTARSPDTVVEFVRGKLIDLLALESCRFEYGSLVGHPPRLEPDGSVLAGYRHWDVEEFGFPDGEFEIRTFRGGDYIGRFMCQPTPQARPSAQARLVAVTLADQAGRAFAPARAPSQIG
jgi:Domain of unknown function (DUF4118)